MNFIIPGEIENECDGCRSEFWDTYPDLNELDYYIGVNSLIDNSLKEVTKNILEMMNIH